MVKYKKYYGKFSNFPKKVENFATLKKATSPYIRFNTRSINFRALLFFSFGNYIHHLENSQTFDEDSLIQH